MVKIYNKISTAKEKADWRAKDLLCRNNCGRNKQTGSSRCKECSDNFKSNI